jgi:excisionase family DNA binding protein
VKDMMEFLTVEEIANTLKVSVQTVRNWIKTGKLPALKVGRQWRVRKEDFEKYLEGD